MYSVEMKKLPIVIPKMLNHSLTLPYSVLFWQLLPFETECVELFLRTFGVAAEGQLNSAGSSIASSLRSNCWDSMDFDRFVPFSDCFFFCFSTSDLINFSSSSGFCNSF